MSDVARGGGAHAGTLKSESATTQASMPRLYSLLSKLELPRTRTAVVVLSLVLVAPSVFTGFALDDYVLLGEQHSTDSLKLAVRAPYDLFRWTNPANVHSLIDGGGLAWWTSDQMKMAFMRPLSSLTHAIDYWVWPHSAFAQHVHSVAWFALLLVVTLLTYSRLLASPWTLGVAIALYAFDITHGAPVGWIAGRNALIGALFATMCIMYHHEARSSTGPDRRAFVPAAIASFVLGIFSGELGYAAAPYLFAYALLYDRASLFSRFLSLVPYGVLILIFGAVRAHGGYGVGGGFVAYVDPVEETGRFLYLLPVRIPLLFASQFLEFSADFHGLSLAADQPYIYAFSLALCVVSAWFIWPTLRADRMSRFLMLGAVLSALPVAGGVPSDRLLLMIGFGSLPVLAEAMRRTFAPGLSSLARTAEAKLRVAAASVFAFLHLGLNVLLLPICVCLPAFFGQQAHMIADAMKIDASKKQTVIITGLPPAAAFYALGIRAVEGKPNPDRLYWLFGSGETAQLSRLSSHLLRVSNKDGIFNSNWEDRSPDLPLHAQDRVYLTDVTITVNEVTPDGRPTIVDFDFRQPLESDSYVWLKWNDAKLEPYAPPREGSSDAVATTRF